MQEFYVRLSRRAVLHWRCIVLFFYEIAQVVLDLYQTFHPVRQMKNDALS